MTRIAAVMVTHNGGRRLLDQVETMCRQTHRVDQIVVIDDRSTDGSVEKAVRRLGEVHDDIVVRVATPGSGTDLFGRIGRNFAQGVALVDPGIDSIVFADQDDMWLEDRVSIQAARLEAHPSSLVSSANGLIVDDSGSPSGRTLWDAFDVPRDWSARSDVDQLRTVLRQSVATGAAMIARSSFVKDLGAPPAEWLHDRWYSIAAASRGGLDLDEASVIEYRKHDEQSAGLAMNSSRRSLVTQSVRGPLRVMHRVRAIHALRPSAPAGLRRELAYPAVVTSMARRSV